MIIETSGTPIKMKSNVVPSINVAPSQKKRHDFYH